MNDINFVKTSPHNNRYKQRTSFRPISGLQNFSYFKIKLISVENGYFIMMYFNNIWTGNLGFLYLYLMTILSWTHNIPYFTKFQANSALKLEYRVDFAIRLFFKLNNIDLIVHKMILNSVFRNVSLQCYKNCSCRVRVEIKSSAKRFWLV